MFGYRKRLFYPVYVDFRDPAFGQILSEHYAGQNSELTLAAQYMNHHLNINNRQLKELLGLIAAEELSHMEMIGLALSKLGTSADYVDSSEKPWTSSFVDKSQETLAILEADIQAEERLRDLYLKHMELTRDISLKRMLQFLSKREDVHKELLQKAHKLVKGQGAPDQFAELIYDYKIGLQILD